MSFQRVLIAGFALVAASILAAACGPKPEHTWSDDEITAIRSLWIGSLEPLPPDPSNQYADDERAAKFGQKLFFDTRFSVNGEVACVTCHSPIFLFQDGTPLAQGVGTTNRRTMTLIGTAYSPWFFWDGRKDSQWAQALGPMENPVEHGGNRTQYAHLIAEHYRDEYESIFGPLPDLSGLPPNAGPVEDEAASAGWDAMSEADREAVSRVYANMGKAIAAYERHLLPGGTRFDQYADAALDKNYSQMDKLYSADEATGLRLFIGKANCLRCHNGPLFTDNDFHNTGVPAVATLPEDTGRALGAQQVRADEFNCLSRYSDAKPDDCAELRFMLTEGVQLVRAFKPPSLRGVANRWPYMHAGQFNTLEQVLSHYNDAPVAPAGHSELEPLGLSELELTQLLKFLLTLDGALNTEVEWLSAPQTS